jgi:hypothetical protein
MQEAQQASAIVQSVQGPARDLCRTITPTELMNGGMNGGVWHGPVAFVLKGLHQRFGNLDDESRMQALQELNNFQRYRGETMNSFLTRYEVARARTHGRQLLHVR